jgi:primary-amine oxidase
VVTHHTRDKDHSSPAAADRCYAAQIRHPLDPLDAAEIRQAVEILRRERPVSPDARFVSVSLNELPKDQVAFPAPDRPAPGQAADAGPGTAVPREAFIVLLEPRQHATYEATVSLTTGSLLSWRLVP